MTERLRINRLGHRGDGIADGTSGPVYVPYALPGETVVVALDGDRGRIGEIVEPSPARVVPGCPKFGICGGCAVQHLDPLGYFAWKGELVRGAFAKRGLDVPVAEPITVPPRSRRRAVFAARRVGKEIVLGYHAPQSHRIVPVAECLVVLAAIEEALPHLAAWLEPLISSKGEARITVTETLTGLDVVLDGRPPHSRSAVAEIAASVPAGLDLARLSVAGEVVIMPAQPKIEIDGIAVALPPGAFLQAVVEAEQAMAGLVLDWLGNGAPAADLYAGIGTFALRLARRAPVLAVEGDDAALHALADAARRAPGLKPVETLRRDLQRQPLSAQELNRFEAVVFDPPRAGAKAQAEEIARSSVRRVVAVSCNPATLARDLRLLVDGGYQLRQVVPVDQFLHSAHIEAVALLERNSS